MAQSRRPLRKRSRKGKKSSPVIAILTDFGMQDQYVASMKGVILSINPAAKIVDISHEVTPQKIRQAGYLLWSAYRFFPKGTVFICVVDPGVGSDRRIIGVRTKQYTFLAPDNGLLDLILYSENLEENVVVMEKKVKKYILDQVTSTFHGRDVFAPLSAHLTNGVPLKRFGEQISPSAVIPPFVHSRVDVTQPCILHIDRFGNIITNIFAKGFEQISKELQAVSIGNNLISRWIQFYSEAPDRTPYLIVGSSGLVEVSVKNSSAARLLSPTLDSPVKVYWQ